MAVEVVDLSETKTMTSSAKNVPVDQISAKLGEIYGAVFGQVMSNGGEPIGQPFARYDMVGDHLFDIEAGIPVAAHVPGTDTIKQSTLPGGPAAKLVHVGDYEGISGAHQELHQWIAESGRDRVGNPWEIYLTDPGQEPDSSKWVTEIYYPLGAE